MIISHRHRFIFFAVPKTGTHAVREALRQQLGPDDLEQAGLFVKKRLPFREFDAIPHGHLTAQQIRPVLGADVFDGYFKFAFVRNPFDRFVSYCAFMSRGTDHFQRAPTAFMKHVLKEMRPAHHVLFWPQHTFLVDADGRLALDYVARTESMQDSYDEICRRLGLPRQVLRKVNASDHAPYATYYDDELVALVGEIYRQDLTLFGYRFEDHAGQPA
ncbi:MAG TPA: sulfotransferase family 2 domain-containing protein [Dokdonella sp.]